MVEQGLQIDLMNPADLRAKLPLVDEIIKRKEDQMHSLLREIETFRNFYVSLTHVLTHLEDAATSSSAASPQGDLRLGNLEVIHHQANGHDEGGQTPPVSAGVTASAVEYLNKRGVPTDLSQIAKELERRNVHFSNRNALGATLYSAARNGRIRRVGKGVYASIEASQGLQPEPHVSGEADRAAGGES